MTASLITAAAPRALTILHFIPTLEGGGAERQLSMLAAEHARRGHHVHVAVRRAGVNAQAMSGARLHQLGDLRSVNPRLFLAMRRIIAQTRPDIVQTWLPQMDLLGGTGALASRIPWIISERTSGLYYKEIPALARLRRRLGRLASAVVCNSRAGEAYWEEAALRSPGLATIPNAVDVERIQRAAGPDLPEPLPRPLLLVVGRFSQEKAHEIIVRALGRLSSSRPVTVLMIGEGPTRPEIEQEIEAASLSGRIRMLPYQPDWWRWLKLADGLISMSRYEGNPNVVLEAMAGCCPLILSDIPAHREIADPSSALFVPVDDPNALSAAIGELIAGKDAARLRAQQALARVGTMTVAAMADAYEAVYAEVLGRSR
jgi:glycosyltransferase involved in cell wall biosynthesis